MASDWGAISARIVAQMITVPRIGNVYPSRRLAFDEEGIIAVVRYHDPTPNEDVIRYWTLASTTPKASWADSSGRLEWKRSVRIEGYLQVHDATDQTASEILATQLAESIVRTLAADVQASKLGGTVLDGDVPQIQTNEARVLSNFLMVHYVLILFPVLSIE